MESEQQLSSDAEQTTPSPTVSVLLPAYNAADTVEKAAESILTGNDVPLELIVIDDGSTDGTREVLERIARDPRVRVISHQNMGLAASLNKGIAAATAPFIARMDADDISAPGRLDRQLQFLLGHPDVVTVGGQIRRVVNEQPRSTSDLPLDHRGIVNSLLHGQHAVCHASTMTRKSALEAVGGYWEQGVSEDWDLFLRLSEVGKLANLNRHVYDIVYHETGINASGMKNVRTNICLAICNYRRRRRGLEELTREEYLDNLSAWERVRINAQTRSQQAYRYSMLQQTSHPAAGKFLLATAAMLWPPFALRRIAHGMSRKLPLVRRHSRPV
ncbi:glycosyltransferase family 2 protein [Mycobacterium sp. 3519A]|uniref:glycosyltransferase family 2 protein n=1 Tax=Mycobacterium sp. 3519A TaxID=2057184 RepID=UPI00135B6E8B|nr:glycosyltransferase family 2 protein [Mycobacterium sp. 3519A]